MRAGVDSEVDWPYVRKETSAVVVAEQRNGETEKHPVDHPSLGGSACHLRMGTGGEVSDDTVTYVDSRAAVRVKLKG